MTAVYVQEQAAPPVAPCHRADWGRSHYVAVPDWTFKQTVTILCDGDGANVLAARITRHGRDGQLRHSPAVAFQAVCGCVTVAETAAGPLVEEYGADLVIECEDHAEGWR